MGGAALCLEGAQGLLFNPGALTRDRTPTLFAGANDSYGKAGIRTYSAGIAGGLPLGALGGMAVTQSGNIGWRRTGLTAGLARRAGLASIGVQAWLHQTAFLESSQYNRLSFSVGGIAYPAPGLRLAGAVHNLGKPYIGGPLEEPAPVALQAGLLYQAGQSTLFSLQADKFGSEGVTFRAGIEHRVIPVLALRIGATQNPGQVFAGMGIQMRKLTLDYGFGYHPVLGSRHSLGLGFALPSLRRKQGFPIDPDCLPEILML